MKLLKQTLALAAALVGLTVQSEALTIGDAYYLGEVDPSTPTDEQAEAAYINYLRLMAPGSTALNVTSATIGVEQGNPNNEHDFTRSANVFGSLPVADEDFSDKEDSNDTTIDVTGWSYLFAKYGNDGHVWYVGDLTGIQTLPSARLSHSTLFAPHGVPDGGATAVLLGLGVLGLAVFRRNS